MGSVSLTGSDTIKLKSRIMTGFADGDIGVLEFSDDIVGVKKGKNGNTLYALNESGSSSNLTLKFVLGCADDKFLNSEIAAFRNDPASYILMDGEVIKRVGDGAGNITNVIYFFNGAIVKKIPGVKSNIEGDTDQATAVYNIAIPNTNRGLT
jgi:hypothetical protein